MHWSDEESQLLKAIFTWQDRPDEKAAAQKAATAAAAAGQKKHMAGEFRILVVGAKATGKTAILTRVRKYLYQYMCGVGVAVFQATKVANLSNLGPHLFAVLRGLLPRRV